MPLLEVDFLIVGQGLAGSLLAFELLQRQQTVLVIDNQNIGSSSQVAAGIINPITGHRLNLSEGFIAYVAQAKDTYAKLEQLTGALFYKDIEQHRLIKNPGQASYFAKRRKEALYDNFLAPVEQQRFNNNEHGAALVKQTALVDSKTLLKEVKLWLQSINAYQALELDYSALKLDHDGVSLDGVGGVDVKASKIIFCEGYQAIHNPWLKALPFKLSKGEVLTLRDKSQTQPQTMLSWGNWYVPQSNGLAKLGSNYAWDDLGLSPSAEVKNKLLSGLRKNIDIDAELVAHEVGIRPTTKYRQPFIGAISGLENAYCFNGFGSKGCLTIPQHAANLCDLLIHNKPLPSEVTRWL